jgi:hypothetical protein
VSGLYHTDLNRYRPEVTICTTSLTFINFTVCHRVYFCVWCGYEKKQILFPYTAYGEWFCNTYLKLYRQDVTICTTSLHSTSLRSAHTVYLCVSNGYENKQLLFPYTALSEWFSNTDLTLYIPWVTICTTSLTFNNFTVCLHSVFMCLVWIREQTELFPYTEFCEWFCNTD